MTIDDKIEVIGNQRIINILHSNGIDTFRALLYRLNGNPDYCLEHYRGWGHKYNDILFEFLKNNNLEPESPREFRIRKRDEILAPYFEYCQYKHHNFNRYFIGTTDMLNTIRTVAGYDNLWDIPDDYVPTIHEMIKEIIAAEEQKIFSIKKAFYEIRKAKTEGEG